MGAEPHMRQLYDPPGGYVGKQVYQQTEADSRCGSLELTNQAHVGVSEQFEFIPAAKEYASKVAVKSHRGTYWSAPHDVYSDIRMSRTNGAWEAFEKVDVDAASFALKTHHGHFIT